MGTVCRWQMTEHLSSLNGEVVAFMLVSISEKGVTYVPVSPTEV